MIVFKVVTIFVCIRPHRTSRRLYMQLIATYTAYQKDPDIFSCTCNINIT